MQFSWNGRYLVHAMVHRLLSSWTRILKLAGSRYLLIRHTYLCDLIINGSSLKGGLTIIRESLNILSYKKKLLALQGLFV